jgi:hypothetical protein
MYGDYEEEGEEEHVQPQNSTTNSKKLQSRSRGFSHAAAESQGHTPRGHSSYSPRR